MSMIIREQKQEMLPPASSEENIYVSQQVPLPPPPPNTYVEETPRRGSYERERRPSLPPKNYQHLEQIYANVPAQMMQINKQQQQLTKTNSGLNLIQPTDQSPYRGSNPEIAGQRSLEAFKPTYVQPVNHQQQHLQYHSPYQQQTTNHGTPISQQANQNTQISQPANQNTPHVQVHVFHNKDKQKSRIEGYQRFLNSKLNSARYTGIIQTTLGVLSVIIGVLMPILYDGFGNIGFGIWCGILTIIAGALSIAMTYTPEQFGTRCAALTFCVFTIVCSFVALLLLFIEFSVASSCDPSATTCNREEDWDSNYQGYRYKYKCTNTCETTGGYYFALLLALIMVAIFVLSIVNAVITSRGCCNCCDDGCCRASDRHDEVFTQSSKPESQQYHQQSMKKHQSRRGTLVTTTNQAFDNVAMVTTHDYPQQGNLPAPPHPVIAA